MPAMEEHAEQALHLLKQLRLEQEDSDAFVETQPPDPAESPPNLSEVEVILRYEFRNKRLLEEAFTDASYSQENCYSYERLEYVGDSVLNLLITKEQYFLYPSLPPGSLTRLRAANVDTEKLARVAITHGFHRYVRHKKPDFHIQIEEFTRGIEEYPLHSNGLIKVPKILADVVESTIGAVFIDSDASIDTVWKIFKGLLEPLITVKTIKRHPMTELYEICQKRNLKLEFVDLWKESMEVHVLIEKRLVGTANYGGKKEIAQNRAAKDALNKLDTVFGELNEPCQPM